MSYAAAQRLTRRECDAAAQNVRQGSLAGHSTAARRDGRSGCAMPVQRRAPVHRAGPPGAGRGTTKLGLAVAPVACGPALASWACRGSAPRGASRAPMYNAPRLAQRPSALTLDVLTRRADWQQPDDGGAAAAGHVAPRGVSYRQRWRRSKKLVRRPPCAGDRAACGPRRAARALTCRVARAACGVRGGRAAAAAAAAGGDVARGARRRRACSSRRRPRAVPPAVEGAAALRHCAAATAARAGAGLPGLAAGGGARDVVRGRCRLGRGAVDAAEARRLLPAAGARARVARCGPRAACPAPRPAAGARSRLHPPAADARGAARRHLHLQRHARGC